MMNNDSFFSTKMGINKYLDSSYPLPVFVEVPDMTTHIEYVVADEWSNWYFFNGAKLCGSVVSTIK